MHTSDSTTASTAASTTLMQHLTMLADTIGPRPAGTPAHAAAAEYIERHFAGAGLHVENLPFTCPGWDNTATTLTLDGDTLHAAANIASPACDISAPTVAAGTVAELEAADLTGAIAVLYDDLARQPLIPLHCPIYNTERDQHINRLLHAKQPAAVLMVNPYQGNVERRIEDVDFPVPSATVPAEVGAHLLHRRGATVRLRIDASQQPVTARHVLAFKPGPRPERIAIMAHFDTKLDTPGAWDNGGGVAALLGVATALAGRDLGCGVEFIAFGDEENYSYDFVDYIRERGDQFGTLLAAINFDGIAHILGHNTIMMTAHSPAFEAAVQPVVADYPRVTWADPWIESDHTLFSWHGVPTLALTSSAEWQTTRHLPSDTPLWLSPDGLAEAADLVAAIVTRIADATLGWTRPAPAAEPA